MGWRWRNRSTRAMRDHAHAAVVAGAARGAKQEMGELPRIAKEVLELARARVDPELRGRALILLERIDHFGAVESGRRGGQGARSAAALRGARGAERVSRAERLERATRALADPEPGVRIAAIERLEEIASRPALMALAHQLAIEKRERVRWRIVGFLRARSGEDHGFDAAAWAAWAEKVQGPWSTGGEPVRRGPLVTRACSWRA
jgi:hypothetical protein